MPATIPPFDRFTNTLTLGDTHSRMHGRNLLQQENVMAYGATGNGSTDDTASMQAASTAASAAGGAFVFVPPGVYKLTSSLTLGRGVVFVGAGYNTKLLHNAGTNPLISVSGSGLAPSNIEIRDMTILGGTGTGNGIHLAGTSTNIISGVHIDNVTFQGLAGASSYGILGVWALESVVTRCSWSHQVGYGIMFDNTSNVCIIRDNTLSNSADGVGGIWLRDSANCIVEGNVIENWRGQFGLRLDGTGITNVIGNHFESNNGDHIRVEATTSGHFAGPCVIQGNILDAGTTNGFNAVSGMLGATFISNTIQSPLQLTSDPLNNQVTYVLIANSYASGGSVVDTTSDAHGDVVVRIADQPYGGYGYALAADRGWMELSKFGLTPPAPAANGSRLYLRDNGSGKMQLVVRFPTGAVQTLATEP